MFLNNPKIDSLNLLRQEIKGKAILQDEAIWLPPFAK